MSATAFQRMRREQAAREAADQEQEQEQEQEQKQGVSEELQKLRERGKELGIPRASQMGKAKLLEAIVAKEAENAAQGDE